MKKRLKILKKNIKPIIGGKSLELVIKSLKQNSVIKGELKSEREWRFNTRVEMLDKKAEIEILLEENTKLKAEIEQLKLELEQSVKLQEVLLRATWGSEWSRCYMCDNSMKNITLDGKNNGCDGSCYHSSEYTKEDLLDKIKREIDRTERTGVK